MYLISSKAVCLVLPAFLPLATAQIILSSINGCTNNVSQIATYSTQLTLPTGLQRISHANIWQQRGTNWIISTDTKGITLKDLEVNKQEVIPGILQADHDMNSIDGSKTKLAISIPTTLPSGGQYDIIFNAVASSSASFPTVAGVRTNSTYGSSASLIHGSKDSKQRSSGYGTATSTSGTISLMKRHTPEHAHATRVLPAGVTKTAISELKVQKHPPIGAKFRRSPSPTTFQLTIVGMSKCLSSPSGTIANSTASVTSNAAVASMCSNNEISAVTQSWTTYSVSNRTVLRCY